MNLTMLVPVFGTLGACTALLEGSKDLEFLNLSGKKLRDDDIVAISKRESLKKLKMENCALSWMDKTPQGEQKCRADLRLLGNLKCLEELTFHSTRLEDEDIQAISGLENLRRLEMRGCDLDGADLMPLSALRHLEELDVSGNLLTQVTRFEANRDDSSIKNDIQAISGIVNLKKLVMQSCALGRFETIYLPRQVTLRHDQVDLRPLGALKYLEELDVSWAVLSEDNVQAILGLKNLKKLVVLYCGLRSENIRSLRALPHLKELVGWDQQG